jgi:hypothetical protein
LNELADNNPGQDVGSSSSPGCSGRSSAVGKQQVIGLDCIREVVVTRGDEFNTAHSATTMDENGSHRQYAVARRGVNQVHCASQNRLVPVATRHCITPPERRYLDTQDLHCIPCGQWFQVGQRVAAGLRAETGTVHRGQTDCASHQRLAVTALDSLSPRWARRLSWRKTA